LTSGRTKATLVDVTFRLHAPATAAGLLLLCSGIGGCSAAAAAAASSSSLQSQTQSAANPAVDPTASNVLLSEPMAQAQLLCTTSLNYRPCALVQSTDTVNCFLMCQGQILRGATDLVERAAAECASMPREEAPPPSAVDGGMASDRGSPACELRVADDSPLHPEQLRVACNARCRELQGDGGAVPSSP
jgi:hypothetical protein